MLLKVLDGTQLKIFNDNKTNAQLLKRALVNRLCTASGENRLTVILADTLEEPICYNMSDNNEVAVSIQKNFFLKMKTPVDPEVISEFISEVDGPLIIKALQK